MLWILDILPESALFATTALSAALMLSVARPSFAAPWFSLSLTPSACIFGTVTLSAATISFGSVNSSFKASRPATRLAEERVASDSGTRVCDESDFVGQPEISIDLFYQNLIFGVSG